MGNARTAALTAFGLLEQLFHFCTGPRGEREFKTVDQWAHFPHRLYSTLVDSDDDNGDDQQHYSNDHDVIEK